MNLRVKPVLPITYESQHDDIMSPACQHNVVMWHLDVCVCACRHILVNTISQEHVGHHIHNEYHRSSVYNSVISSVNIY